MLSKAEIKKWLLENCVDTNGDLILSGLDFSDFDGDVYISEMKVKNNLFQSYQTVGVNLCQNYQIVGKVLYQYNQKVGQSLFQYLQEVGGNLYQDSQKVEGNLWQNYQTVGEDLWQDSQKVGKNLFQDPRTEDITSMKEWLSLLKKSGVNSKQQVIKQMELYIRKNN